MGIETALFIGGSALLGAGVGGLTSAATGGDFWKGALVGGLTGAVSGGVGAFAGGTSSALSGVTSAIGKGGISAGLKAAAPIALKTSLLAGGATMVAGTAGLTKKSGTDGVGGTSATATAIEKKAEEDYSKASVRAMTISELQRGNANITGTFGNTTSQFTRARLLNT